MLDHHDRHSKFLINDPVILKGLQSLYNVHLVAPSRLENYRNVAYLSAIRNPSDNVTIYPYQRHSIYGLVKCCLGWFGPMIAAKKKRQVEKFSNNI